MKLLDVPVDSIVRFEHERTPKASDVEMLAASLKQAGQQHPILLYPVTPEKYAGIFGKHRLDAVKKMGNSTVRAVVFDQKPEGDFVLVARFLENAFHRKLTPKEKRTGVCFMFDNGMSPEEISNRTLFSQAEVRDILHDTGKLKKRGRPRLQSRQKTQRKSVKKKKDVQNVPVRDRRTVGAVTPPATSKGRHQENPVFRALRDVEQNLPYLQENVTVFDNRLEKCKLIMKQLLDIPEVSQWIKQSPKYQSLI